MVRQFKRNWLVIRNGPYEAGIAKTQILRFRCALIMVWCVVANNVPVFGMLV